MIILYEFSIQFEINPYTSKVLQIKIEVEETILITLHAKRLEVGAKYFIGYITVSTRIEADCGKQTFQHKQRLKRAATIYITAV